MARKKLSEFRAKSLLNDEYDGTSIRLDTAAMDCARLHDGVAYVIKVDQGIKKRGKQGLIRLNVEKSHAEMAVRELAEKGFSRFIAEPMFVHEDNEEHYVSFERSRSGILMNYSPHGGVDVEESPERISSYLLTGELADDLPMGPEFARHIIDVMNREHFSFVEINPLIVRDNNYALLDAAVLVDSAGDFQASWNDLDIVEARTPTPAEEHVAELNDNSTAAFSLRILNPNGGIWLLLSGGGASITIADEASNAGRANMIGNYGEYSGGPTAEETYLYTNEVLASAFASNAPKKAIIIAGGVANFSDVKKTFTGIIQSLTENLVTLQSMNIKIFVRRGGPNEKEGLAMMQKFLEENNLYGSVHGSETVLTDVIHEALGAIDA